MATLSISLTDPFWRTWVRILCWVGVADFCWVHDEGKYQLQVFPEAGHFIQEDLPQRTAMVLVDFYKRNDRSALVLPPKVGELLKKKGWAG